MSGRREWMGARPWLLAFVVAVLVPPGSASAHDFAPGVLVLVETDTGSYDAAWTEPVDSLAAAEGVKVFFPSPCTLVGARLDCSGNSLEGTIRFEGMTARRVQVLVSIHRRDDSVVEALVDGDHPELLVSAARGRSFSAWLRLGVGHVFAGLSPLGFVFGLTLLLGFTRRLGLALASFAGASALALVLGSLGPSLPALPVDAVVAASVVLVAREALLAGPTGVTRRWPWLTAAVAGIAHGFGFANALRVLGVTSGREASAIAGFDLGIVLGGLATLMAAYALVSALRRLGDGRRYAWAAVGYLVGGLAAWLFIERTLAIFTG